MSSPVWRRGRLRTCPRQASVHGNMRQVSRFTQLPGCLGAAVGGQHARHAEHLNVVQPGLQARMQQVFHARPRLLPHGLRSSWRRDKRAELLLMEPPLTGAAWTFGFSPGLRGVLSSIRICFRAPPVLLGPVHLRVREEVPAIHRTIVSSRHVDFRVRLQANSFYLPSGAEPRVQTAPPGFIDSDRTMLSETPPLASDPTLLGGRQPLCGSGRDISRWAFRLRRPGSFLVLDVRAAMADPDGSRAPWTRTRPGRTAHGGTGIRDPALAPQRRWRLEGVDFFDPLNPAIPALDQTIHVSMASAGVVAIDRVV